jgi:hypothetical protein
MKYANGNASTASVTVTAAAIPIVRSAIERYADDSKIVLKFPRFQTCSISVVSELTCQNADTKRTTSAAR